MELIIAIVVVALGAALYFNRKSPALDVNKDGHVDVKDAVEVAVKVEEAVVAEVKTVATKAKTAAKKVAAKKAPAKKTVKAAATKKTAPAKKAPAKTPAKPKK
jgi:hypothetical protein